MANEEHLGVLRQGVEVWNDWRTKNPEVQPDLSRVDLTGVVLKKANLINADLSGINFTNGDLTSAYFVNAHFFKSVLVNADLRWSSFYGAIFTDADLSGAALTLTDLRFASFSTVDIEDADFARSRMGRTTFVNVDLSSVKGLGDVAHLGPSYVDVHTIYRSKGKIPEIFLRGAGIPDSMIEFMHSLARSEQTIDFYSSFISYSSRDQTFAERLHADLQDKGVRCWFAPEDMKIGDKIRPTLDQSIRVHDKLLLILSKHSVESDWVEQEVETALARERQEKRTVLFPIRLDDAVMEIEVGWPALIRNTRHIGDFRNWKDHDAYQKAFGRLLRDLKAEKSAT